MLIENNINAPALTRDPVGPLHDKDGLEVWIAEVPVSIREMPDGHYDELIRLVPNGRVLTIITTTGRGIYYVTEPIAEVVERFGWKSDREADQ